MKGFLITAGLFIFGMTWISDFVGDGRLLALADKNPDRKGTATTLYYVGRYYELFSKDDKALEYFQRISDRYPKSRYGMEAQYAVALSYEKLKKFSEAMAEYEEFVEKYPKSKYTISVRNNIEILKSR